MEGMWKRQELNGRGPMVSIGSQVDPARFNGSRVGPNGGPVVFIGSHVDPIRAKWGSRGAHVAPNGRHAVPTRNQKGHVGHVGPT